MMTQTDLNRPYTGQRPDYDEEIHVMGEQLAATVERLIHEGNVRRIIIKQEGHTILEIPLTIGLVGVLVAPMLAAVGAIGAAVTNCTIEVVRTEPPQQMGGPPPAQETSQPIFSAFSGQSYSIAHSGMQLFQQGKINTLMSATVIDLVSAPIPPGDYRLEITVTMGGVEIFLPHYVQFTLEGSAIAGGRNVHEGPQVWETMKRKLHYLVNLPDQPLDFMFATFNPEQSVRIHFVTHITMGGLDIYRL
jgi:uncharacterized protein DUF4342/cell wall-active antibiotic response 4TMS protein YvqF